MTSHRTGVFLRLPFCEEYQYPWSISLKFLDKMWRTHLKIKVNYWLPGDQEQKLALANLAQRIERGTAD